MAKRRLTCTRLHCEKPPFLGGLCEEHYREAEVRRQRREEALGALDSGLIDGQILAPGAMRDEFWQMRQ